MRYQLRNNLKFIGCALGLASVLVMSPSLSTPGEKDFLEVPPERIVWKDAGRGVKIAVIYGDLNKPGQYVIRAHFPPGVMSSSKSTAIFLLQKKSWPKKSARAATTPPRATS